MPDIEGITISQDLYEDSKKVLQQTNDEGVSLYDHLSRVILKVLEENPANAVNIFENISTNVKEDTFKPPQRELIEADEQQNEKDIASGEACTSLYKPPAKEVKVNEDGEEEEEAEDPNPEGYSMPDVIGNLNALSEAGVGISQEESFRILLALKRLASTRPLKAVRFFGKILTTSGQYYVAESEWHEGQGVEEEPKKEEDEEANEEEAEEGEDGAAKEAEPADKKIVIPNEEMGSGANKYTYWVCVNLGEQWTRLPNVQPAWISASRQIRKYFSGDLNAGVTCYPPFPGTEAQLLRAQIARIASATVICPKGAYTLGGEDEEPEEGAEPSPSEEFAGVNAEESVELENWIHLYPYVLPQGRVAFWKPEKEGGDEEEEEEEAAEDNSWPVEEGPAVLNPLSEDAALGGHPAWTIRLNDSNPKFPSFHLRSSYWPGAVAYGVGNRFGSVYVGYGVKGNPAGVNYTPVAPPAVLAETAVTDELKEAEIPAASTEQEFEDQERELEAKEQEDAQAEGEGDE